MWPLFKWDSRATTSALRTHCVKLSRVCQRPRGQRLEALPAPWSTLMAFQGPASPDNSA